MLVLNITIYEGALGKGLLYKNKEHFKVEDTLMHASHLHLGFAPIWDVTWLNVREKNKIWSLDQVES